ncbi:hypothetical protein SAMN05421827_12741 [Pedobacter terrae]|uniref:Uncharacterized protein n=1 Tax=Pedobacter terrae TaxID=405671 RepID=A0A1G8D0E4_9SPHI|nr:hypothetical protein [Pedobacter terrae]SDH50903.1 hypothetical protein SAMN05421827_12741 [Pedobacter terrae]
MKQLFFLFFFVIAFGLQVSYAAAIGMPEIILILVIGFMAIAIMVGIVLLCVNLIKKAKATRNEE